MTTPTSLRRLRIAALLSSAAFSASATRAGAQPAATVAVTDPAYRLVDRLLARVPVRSAIVGQRPYSRRELARLSRVFAAALRRRAAPDAPADRLLAALVEAVGDTATGDAMGRVVAGPGSPVRLLPLESASLATVVSGEAPRAIPANGIIGEIDARTVPALDARGGRPIVRGAVTSIETSHVLGIGRALAVVAEPRMSWLASSDGSRVSIVPQRLLARGVWRNAALQAGIDALTWGPAAPRGLVFSENAAPLRALSLGTEAPVVLPWVLRYIGPLRASIVVADLGRDQTFPHAKLAAYKLSATPWARLEVGAEIFSEFGGRGAPPLSFRDRLLDLVPYVTWIHPGTDKAGDKLASNKLAASDLRLSVPELAGLTLYYEGAVDDLDFRRVRSVLWEDTAHLLGARFDALAPDGTLSLDVQLHHTSLRIYEHAQFTSGLTYRQGILGDPLGPNASAGYVTLAWRPAPLTEVAGRVSVERRDASPYKTTVINAREDAFTFVRTASLPIEGRGRVEGIARRDLLHGLGLMGRVGIERVTNETFRARGATWSGFGEASLSLRP